MPAKERGSYQSLPPKNSTSVTNNVKPVCQLKTAFMDEHPHFKATFEYAVMRLMSEIMAHTITLHLLDAPGRVHRFVRKHPELADRIPKKELAAYLNLAAETLSRLKQQGKI